MSSIKERLRALRARMVAERGSPEYVARGWALGMFIGCSVPFGVQLLVSVPLSFPLKAGKIGAVAGTFITNPITIFFIYPAQTWAADKLLGGNLSYAKLEGLEWSWHTVTALGVDVFAAFFLGGFILAMVLSPITYFVVRALVVRWRKVRAGR